MKDGETWLDRLVADAALNLNDYLGDQLEVARRSLQAALGRLDLAQSKGLRAGAEAAAVHRIRNTLERALAMDPFGDKPVLDLATLQQSIDHAVSHAGHILDRSPATPRAGVTITAEVRVTAHREGKPSAEALEAARVAFREWRDANLQTTGAHDHRIRVIEIYDAFHADHPETRSTGIEVAELLLELEDVALGAEGRHLVMKGIAWRTDRAGT